MIHFNKIKLKNFMSFQETEFDFDKTGLILVHGETGSGKSTLFIEGVYWCLFGKTIKKCKANEVVNDDIGTDCSVELEFSDTINGTENRIVRYRNHADKDNAVELFVDGEEQDNQDIQQLIEDIIGMSEKRFTISCIISNDETSNLLSVTKGKRTDIFEEEFGLSGIEEYEKRCSNAMKEINGRISLNTNMMTECNSIIKTIKKSITDFNTSREKKTNALQEEINSMVDFINNLKSVDIKAAEKIIQQQIDLDNERQKMGEELSELETEMNDVEKSDAKLKRELIKNTNEIESLKDDICPECDSIINADKVKELRGRREKRNGEIAVERDRNKKVIALCKKKISGLADQKVEIEEEYLRLKNERNRLVPKTVRIENLRSEIEESENQLRMLEKSLKDMEYNSFIREREEELAKVQRKLPRLAKRESLLKERLEYWKFLKRVFDIKEDGNIKEFRIKQVIPSYNKILAGYVDSFFPNMNARLKFGDNLDEDIRLRGKNRSYRMLSKGQRKKMDNSINFTSFTMDRMMNNPIAFLGVDEALDGIDTLSQHAILDVLSVIARDNAVYIISHEKSIVDSVDRVFEVTMEDGVSSVKEVT